MKRNNKKVQEYDVSLYGTEEFTNSLALLYHENSKLSSYGLRQLGERISSYSNPYFIKRTLQPFKYYPNATSVNLKGSVLDAEISSIDLGMLLKKRKSIRHYDANYSISQEKLATILYHSYGVTSWQDVEIANDIYQYGRRNLPSAGGLYPLELYVVILHSNIPSGLYHYQAKENKLELISLGNYRDRLLSCIQAEPYVELSSSSVVLLISAFPERQMIKYGERGYRFIQSEVGEVTLMVSLLSEALSLGTCILGGFNDDELNNFIGLDGSFETIQSVMIIGKDVSNEKYPTE